MVGHKVRLEGVRLPGAGEAQGPAALSILEQDFVGWLLERLPTEAGREELGGRDAFARRNKAGEPRLWQPVHRAFNVVLVHAFCEVEGLPRLDPRKILRAGVVVRRRVEGEPFGWVKAAGRILGWRPLPPDTTAETVAWDPDPATRRQVAEGRNARILRKSALLSPATAEYEETFAPLYPAPPEICKAFGRTLLFGYLPLTSSERSEADPPPEAPFDTEAVLERLPVVLWRDGRRRDMPADERPAAPLANATVRPEHAANPSDALAVVLSAVSYLAQEPGLFTPSGEAGEADPTAELRGLLRARKVDLPNGDGGTESSDLYAVFERIYDVLIRRAEETGTVRLPVRWPEFSEADEHQFAEAVRKAMQARWERLSPGETRFQDLSARYELRAFARIDCSDRGCPPETVWTRPSPPFEIVPWYESGETPPTVVELPAPTAEFMKNLKPNVAFKVPEEIQKFMSGLKLDALTEGKKPGSKLGFGMICGFSIPILTICAFIVLQIFLVLFHILFWWLPFIRICIPFPKPK